jgi:nitrate/nitrite transport system permease protein
MNRLASIFDTLGLTWFVPVVKFIAGENRGFQVRTFLRMVGLPVLAIAIALFTWHAVALHVKIGSLSLPTPGMVYDRGVEQVNEWRANRAAYAAYLDQVATTAKEQKMSEADVRQMMPFENKKLFVDQIILSLETVFVGVGGAMLIAIPIGIFCGLSANINLMMNPLIQIFKPVSPLAWFPLVYLFINKAISGNDGPISKSFVIAAIVVGLCSLWPALMNTAAGVANVEKDHLNVARVLNLGFFTRIRLIILPSAMPAIFTGMRVSLGVGWMVLIAAEMMAVSPGLGGFVWDWYQSSNDIAMAYLVLSVLVIGAIGFVLDRMMITLQKLASRGNTAQIR